MSALDTIKEVHSVAMENLDNQVKASQKDMAWLKSLSGNTIAGEKAIKLKKRLDKQIEKQARESVLSTETWHSEKLAKEYTAVFKAITKAKVSKKLHDEAYGVSETFKGMNSPERRAVEHAITATDLPSFNLSEGPEEGQYVALASNGDKVVFKINTTKNTKGKKKSKVELIK
jgi:hypothetical protein